jgi:hypothetical protein
MEEPNNFLPPRPRLDRQVLEQLLESGNKLRAALLLIEQAIALLDQTDAPGEVAAYLDFARCRLTDAVELPSQRQL